MNKKIKIALIGCGNWGKNIARNLIEMGSLACIYDPESSQANEFINKYKRCGYSVFCSNT
jgi:predicted dehydrogenase